jgi:hypothetical protein
MNERYHNCMRLYDGDNTSFVYKKEISTCSIVHESVSSWKGHAFPSIIISDTHGEWAFKKSQ